MRELSEINESIYNLNEDEKQHSEVEVFMNTWGNYNVNGAEVSSIDGGWMTPEEALEWLERPEIQEQEPFINDVDDYVGLPFEVVEENAKETLEKIIDYLSMDEYDRKVVGAIMEAYNEDYEDAISIKDKGDFVFYEDVETEYDLAVAEIESIGSIVDAVSNLDSYIKTDEMYDDYYDDVRSLYMGENDIDNEEDIDEDDFEEYLNSIIDEDVRMMKAGEIPDTLEMYFDYDSFGSDLSFDFVFTKYGAIYVY